MVASPLSSMPIRYRRAIIMRGEVAAVARAVGFRELDAEDDFSQSWDNLPDEVCEKWASLADSVVKLAAALEHGGRPDSSPAGAKPEGTRVLAWRKRMVHVANERAADLDLIFTVTRTLDETEASAHVTRVEPVLVHDPLGFFESEKLALRACADYCERIEREGGIP